MLIIASSPWRKTELLDETRAKNVIRRIRRMLFALSEGLYQSCQIRIGRALQV